MTDPNLSRLADLQDVFCNHDTGSAADAVRNIGLGRPAYWHIGSAGDHSSSGIINAANFYGTLAYAIETAGPLTDKRFATGEGQSILDRYIPLNEAAVTELAALYVSKAGSFRPAHELRARERRFVLGAWPKDRPSKLVDWDARRRAQARWSRGYAVETVEAA